MHIRIRYHFLVRHAKGHAWIINRKREAHPEYLNKLYGVEIITSQSRDYRSYVLLSEHSSTIENSPMDLFRESQTSTNTSEFKELEDRSRTEWEMTRSLNQASKVQGQERSILQIFVTCLHRFSESLFQRGFHWRRLRSFVRSLYVVPYVDVRHSLNAPSFCDQ